ncbi:uncharacterized protein GIQ15_01812 [Arthroderma uncinatum]|uniref:uncharacterized protein n=1 Tax=Arthroderma uncinatum TaxID=74035 RepID=UPI00144ACDC8|nr:uncharacterized protein GIQ15_01812 [Arthroderma uncinatum]KAF3492295.1 hypothetical protein GIQ15_01812 [Arthroderma uncinatum]
MNEAVPSYEESEASFAHSDKKEVNFIPPPPSLLPQQLAETRTQRIQSILTTYIDPLLYSQGAAGLYKTTFILVPSTVASLQDSPSNAYTTPQEPQIIGFPSDEVVKLVRLRGQDNAMEFWRQPAVVAELDSAMRSRLAASGHRIYEPSAHPEPRPDPPPQQQQPAPAKGKGKLRKSFWGRMAGGSDDPINDQKLGWRAEEPETDGQLSKIPTGLVKVSVAWNEVALRIANAMGLYETQRGPALCLTVETRDQLLSINKLHPTWLPLFFNDEHLTNSVVFDHYFLSDTVEYALYTLIQQYIALITKMAPSTPLSIATGAVQRLVKEEASYQREKEDQERRIEKLSKDTTDDENREYMINQERKALQETEKLLPRLKEKITEAVSKLERLIEEEGQKGMDSDVAQITAAKEAISKSKTAIREIS